MNLLLITLLIPLIGLIVSFFIKKEKENLIKYITLGFSLLTFISSLLMLAVFDKSVAVMQFVMDHDWIPAIDAGFRIGVDGISIWIVMLTTFITPIAMFSSFKSINRSIKEFYSLFLLLEFAMLGVFISLDLILFYTFWELILIPMYFIIGIWGGKDKIYATIKFFIFTLAGSLLLLIGIVWLGNYVGETILQLPTGFTSDILLIQKNAHLIPLDIQNTMFWLFAISFLIKVPVVPLHTWLPDAHTEAPTAGSVILASVLLKMGTYGLIRFNLGFFNAASINYADIMALLAVVGIIWGGLAAMVQKDMKRLVAYSSVAHMGFIVLGIFSFTADGLNGAVLQMVNHGLSTGLLFLCVGFIYEQRHTRLMSEYGGIAAVVPRFAVVLALAMFASIGLPGLNGFVGEFYTLIGAFQSEVLSTKAFAIVGTTGVIIAAVYMLIMYKNVMFGEVTKSVNKSIHDLKLSDWVIVLPILFFIVFIGVQPNIFFEYIRKSVELLLAV